MKKKRFLSILLSVVIFANYMTLSVFASEPVITVAETENSAIEELAAGGVIIKYLFTQMGAVLTGSFDDVIANSEKLKAYYNDGIPVTNNGDGTVTINQSIVNNIYNEVKNSFQKMDGYTLYTQTITPSDYLKTSGITLASGMEEAYDRISSSNVLIAGRVFVMLSRSPEYYFYFQDSSGAYGYNPYTKESVAPTFYTFAWPGFISSSQKFSKENIINYCGEPLKIFDNLASLFSYLKQNPSIYVGSPFYKFNTNKDITVNKNMVTNNNWDQLSNDTYNIINQEKANNPNLTEEQLQTIIDTAINKLLNDLNKPTPPETEHPETQPTEETETDSSGTSETGGGSDDGNKNVLDYLKTISRDLTMVSSKLSGIFSQLGLSLESFNKKMADVLDFLKTMSSDLTLVSSKLSNIFLQSGLSLESFNTKMEDLIKAVKEIDLSGSNGLSNGVGSFVGSALGSILSDLVKSILDGLIPDVELDDAISGVKDGIVGDFTPLATVSKTKFPISLPWDFIAVVMLFKSEPETPVFVIPLDIERFNVHEELTLDMSEFAMLSKASRTMLSITFALMLILITIKFTKGGD